MLGTQPYPVEVYNDLDSVAVFFFDCLRRQERRKQLKDLLQDYKGLDDKQLSSTYRSENLAQAVRVSAWYVCAARLLEKQLKIVGRKKLFNRDGGDFEVFNRKVAGTLYDELRDIDPRLPDFHGRLFRMQFEHYPVEKVVQIYDSPTTLFLVDEDQYDVLEQDVDKLWDCLEKLKGTLFTFDLENATVSRVTPPSV
jgi:hypothetical protein